MFWACCNLAERLFNWLVSFVYLHSPSWHPSPFIHLFPLGGKRKKPISVCHQWKRCLWDLGFTQILNIMWFGTGSQAFSYQYRYKAIYMFTVWQNTVILPKALCWVSWLAERQGLCSVIAANFIEMNCPFFPSRVQKRRTLSKWM